ncbi:MAG: esterase family protein [Tannerellaceae bacterium]|nr:esterase family protein [Tannerellaceae bacterium]
MKKIFLSLFITCLAWGAHAQYPGWGPQSKVVTDSIYSQVLESHRAYTIYLPKSYDTETTRKYPILYLLHGMTGINTSWFYGQRANDVMDRLVASGEACEMIIVSPNAGGDFYAGAWNGYFNMPGWSYEDFFYQEFLPYIESTYRVAGNKQNRAIAGLSMGANGATSYAQRYSDMYCAVYAISSGMTLPDMPAPPDLSPDGKEKMAFLIRAVQEHNCITYVAEADEARTEQLRSIQWFVDCGDDDFLLDTNIDFFRAMRAKQIPCEFRVRDGGHDNEYWHSGLYLMLPFISRSFEK